MTSREVAVNIVKRLFDEGYIAYFAGGWVRDFLMGVDSDEIDIATSAPPEKIQSLFSKSVAVGAAFGVIVVIEEGFQFEVTTFRKDHPYLDGRHPEGVDYTTPEKDALRRDFTINGLFYDPLTKTIHDYVGGRVDIDKKIIRAIGDPHARFQEDKLRMLRAIRFSYRLGFTIEQETLEAISLNAPSLLPAVSMERVYQEFTKMSSMPRFDEALLAMHDLHLLSTIFPQLKGEKIEAKVKPFPYFPSVSPLLYLRELFHPRTLEEELSLCTFLKTSRKEMRLIHFFHESDQLFNKGGDRADWAHFYAHPHSSIYLQIKGAKEGDKRAQFHEEHEAAQKNLSFHIHRLQKKDPILHAHHLMKKGVPPGVEMGILLKQAERVSINEDIRDVETLLKKIL